MKRYARSRKIPGKQLLSTSTATPVIRTLVRNGTIKCKVRLLSIGERLDQIADEEYGDASLWWVIAAASEIGWGLQLPEGTVIRIPIDLALIDGLIG